MDKEKYMAWMQSEMDRTGINLAEIGRRVGLSRTQARRLLMGQRRWTLQIVESLSSVFGVPCPDFNQVHSTISDIKFAHVVGALNPNMWVEEGYFMDDGIMIPFMPDPRYEGLTRTAYRVDYDIPGTQIRAGNWVLAVPFDQVRSQGRDDVAVVLKRKRETLVNHIFGTGHAQPDGSYSYATPLVETDSDLVPTGLIVGIYATV